MEMFFYKYRKLIIVVYAVLLIAFPFKIFKDIAYFTRVGRWEAIGNLLNDMAIYLVMPLFVLGTIWRVHKRKQQEEAKISQKPNADITL